MLTMKGVLYLMKHYYNLTLVTGFGSAFFLYYVLFVAKKPRLCGNSKFRGFLFAHVPILQEKFWPTFWCFEARAQTILRVFIKSMPDAGYHKEFVETADGGHIAVDWQENETSRTHTDSATRPTVLILPGLTGSSQESYALHFVQQATQLGYRSVVFNYRGIGGAELKTARSYSAANTEDLALVVSHIKTRYPNAPVVAAGVSLGGMMLMNYLSSPAVYRRTGTAEAGTAEAGTAEAGTAETGTAEAGTAEAGTEEAGTAEAGTAEAGTAETAVDTAVAGCSSMTPAPPSSSPSSTAGMSRRRRRRARPEPLLSAALVCCAAYDLERACMHLERPLNCLLFNHTLANGLKTNLRRYQHLFEDTVDLEHVFQSKTIRDFDDRFTAKQFGYPSWREYYQDASPHNKIHKIKIPVLCLNAADDPFSPEYALPMKECSESSHVCMIVTRHGGHIGFLEGLFPRHESFMDRVFAQYIDSVFKHGGKLTDMLNKEC